MSEISAWHDATSDMDDIGPRHELAEPAEAAISDEPSERKAAEVTDRDEAEPASVEELDTFESDPTEPVLLLADHSGEDAAEGTAEGLAHDELEHGIASVIASLYADQRDDSSDEDAEDTDEAAEVDDAVTFRLLGELDRLWHRAA